MAGRPGKMVMGESCVELGSAKGSAVFFNGGCRLKRLWCMLRLEQMCPCVTHNMSNMCSEMDLGRHLCEG